MGIRTLVAHVETWRPYTTTYVGLVSLSGAMLANDHPPAWRLLGAWGVPTLGWIAGLYGGDYFDRKLDAIAKPYRPIPSGRLTARSAVVSMMLCVVVGGLLALLLNWRTSVLVAAALGLGIAYSTWFKARGFGGNLIRGGLTVFAFLFGVMTTAKFPPVELLVVAVLYWLHDAGTNLVGALRDVAGDAEGGYQTLPVRRGTSVALGYAAALYVLWLLIAMLVPGVLLDGKGAGGYPVLLSIAAALGAVALVVVLRAPRPLSRRQSLRAHEILVLERVVLASALLSLGAGPVFSVAVVAVAVVVTWLAQHYLRHRYEFAPAKPRYGELASQ